MIPLTAIVLAGGKSSRMGRDKALILIEGLPLLQLVCRVAGSCADTVYIVTPWQERYEHLILPKSQFIQEVALSVEPEQKLSSHGPIVGFAQGLAHVQTEWVLLLACDLPKLRVAVLQDWKAELDTVEDDVIAALVYHVKGWEPLCGFYRRRCLPTLLEYINQGGRSFQEWLKQHPVKVLPLADPEMLLNCNTPEDLPSL
ncbi:molybdenum cofactor guanylyltransferase [Aetokthonos hydrillicola Thurmond2011]|jgi:molybdopterin-guanine dinucleotide biosynthesis protein A|uniref:Probable molybdenum cofactor guanylyltransferase n=1 Tax=Aetokthonos hydrillicola Thurmond2011 TaxID=2712845 RepID=A0AAP5IBV2_9CYAN|nr:molybdenum cofactor guanylyltransferase [Aetokthonos hydrillicola]MBO3462352.1 molybdenum cofactor guanylyltransferase [Aetokthonos hydrillicola CCALA 1050]MBW4584230.1 molybdenum cofactor guanylyltransferase [Aetokthonos hydrillicola CCALA 1050]MDR9898561.1 molybdenum cofactor guanylyltransferase [Aetokthonos hydrillicola Thurmond2011]